MTAAPRPWPALRALVILVMMFIALLALSLALFDHARARDTTGLSQTLSVEMNEWVRGLHSPDGAWCCDQADGIDPAWEITSDGYRVQYQGAWLSVRPDALITAPNRLGVARAWIGFTADTKPYVRCFLPGPTT